MASLQIFDLDPSGFSHHRVVGFHLLRVVSFIIFEKYYLFRGMVSWKKMLLYRNKKRSYGVGGPSFYGVINRVNCLLRSSYRVLFFFRGDRFLFFSLFSFCFKVTEVCDAGAGGSFF